jgi:hypothetical protein|tara:strand:+ start:142 stop:345 length:204 start_codon:yes stop_codon:yes gene_type:complete
MEEQPPTMENETMSNETKRGPGRPRKAPEDLRCQVTLKLSKREHEIAKANAAKVGLNFSDYVRSQIL